MGIEITNNGGEDFLDDIRRMALDDAHEELAEGLAERMREMGRTDADGVEIDIDTDTDDPDYAIDAERVRARANEMLRERP
ncbi:hypothetical protein [Microbacterium sp.]|uniref:hypothetical protein n=1 Tax=Microbacterium sp. TaxID=51671 RepID=UPI003A8DE232